LHRSSISPGSPIVDLTHLIRPLEVLSGALLLADSMPYIAEDAVVLAVIDPTVGKDREVAVEATSLLATSSGSAGRPPTSS
jgi:S-adenosyl-L-methionine hydrolase (adenosine-forming)